MRSINVKVLLGHSIGVENSYYRPQERDLLQDYLKAVPHLTIKSNEITEHVQKHVQKQTQELAVHIESKDREVKELKEQMLRMQQNFKSYDEMMKHRMNELDSNLKYYAGEFITYARKYGHPLSDADRKGLDKFSEQLKNIPDDVE
jgi:DNA repair exonuclease SbcCD ATPase subunit